MEALSPSTINVRLSAVRKMVGEARRNNTIGSEEAASLTDIPNISQKGTRLGNWLTPEQAKELLAVPDRSTRKGKRYYVILALLVGCALRRNELAELDVSTIQQREGRWMLADLEGKGRRIRTVAIPIWVKQKINAWMTAAAIEEGRLLRSISKSGKIHRDLGDPVPEGGPVDIILYLAISENAFQSDELPFLESLGELREIPPGIDAMPFGAAFVVTFVALPAFLSCDVEDDVLFVVLSGFGFCVLPEAADEDNFVEHGVGSVSFGLSAVCGTCLPNGCAVATHSLGDWTESAEGDPNLLWGRSPHLAEARSGFWEGERASEGRRRFERAAR